jgi:hypothetical protein
LNVGSFVDFSGEATIMATVVAVVFAWMSQQSHSSRGEQINESKN